MNALERDLSALNDDGATLELDDGRTLRLRIETDQDWSIDDSDCYGRIGWGETNEGGNPVRPAGFDGGAEKIDTLGGPVWWQPPTDLMIQRGTAEWSAYRSFLGDLISFGFKSVGLELLEGEDHYGRPIVVGAAWLGGIDTLDQPWAVRDERGEPQYVQNGYLAEIVSELAAEVLD